MNIMCNAVQHQSEQNVLIVFGDLEYFTTRFVQMGHFRVTQKMVKLAEKLNL